MKLLRGVGQLGMGSLLYESGVNLSVCVTSSVHLQGGVVYGPGTAFCFHLMCCCLLLLLSIVTLFMLVVQFIG